MEFSYSPSPVNEDLFIITKRGGGTQVRSDKKLAELIKLTLEEYQNVMLTRYNAYIKNNGIHFHTEEDIKNACEFLNMAYKIMDR